MSIPIEQVIDIRELRIGNYFEYDGKIVHVTMLSMDIDNEYEEQICFCELGKSTDEKGDWNRALCDKLRRLPITPDMLKRLGFKFETVPAFVDDGKIVQGYSHWVAGSYCISLEGKEKLRFKHIEYVHQLQNLYYADTGKDLIMSPTP